MSSLQNFIASEVDLMQPHANVTSYVDKSPLIETNDDRLVRLAKGGDEAAFEELYRKHSKMMAKVILRIVKNLEDRDDVLQDVFTRAFLHLKNFDGRSKFSTWLTRIAINTSLMLLRKKRTHPECSIDLDLEHSVRALDIVDTGLDPEKACIRSNSITEVRKAVERLPKSLRQPTVLRCSKELLVRDIATTMGLSMPATKSRLQRAIIELRLMLNADAARGGRIPSSLSNYEIWD